MTFSIEYH